MHCNGWKTLIQLIEEIGVEALTCLGKGKVQTKRMFFGLQNFLFCYVYEMDFTFDPIKILHCIVSL